MRTITTWKQHHTFISTQDGHEILIDGEKENGFSPKALLLSGLAGCSGIDVVDILEKMKVEFSDLRIDAAAEQTEEHPRVFRHIQLTFSLKSDAANEAKIRKAINLSLDKYCGVAAMLKKNSPLTYDLVIE